MKLVRYLIYLIIIIVGLIYIASKLNIFPLYDYLQYWSAVKVNLWKQNPYDPVSMYSVQVPQGWDLPSAIMMWNPPITIGLMLPFGLIPYSASRIVYYLFTLIAISIFAIQTWKIYGGKPEYKWLAFILAITFGPMMQMIKIGQISTWSLIGIIGFLYFIRKNMYFFAGMMASLTLVKPHLVYMLWIALIVWSLSKRLWTIWFGVAAGLIIPLIIAWATNPEVINQYLYTVSNTPPVEWNTATIGSRLRIYFGPEIFWLQFVPTLVGGTFFLVYLAFNLNSWSWEQQMPGVILASIATSSYGWIHDISVGVIAVIAIAASVSKRLDNPSDSPGLPKPVYILVTIYSILTLTLGFMRGLQHNFWWAGSAIFFLYLAFLRWVPIRVAADDSRIIINEVIQGTQDSNIY